MKRIVAVVFCLAMCIALMSACAPSTTPTVANTPTPPVSEQNIKVQIYTSDYGSAGGSTMVEDDKVKEFLEKKFNITIDFTMVPSSGKNEEYTRLNMMIAAGKIPDIFCVSFNGLAGQIYQSMADNQLLVDVGKMVEENPSKWPTIKSRVESPGLGKFYNPADGKLYCVPITADVTDNAIMIRQDWLDALDLEIPKNTDELYEVLKAFVANDPDGTKNIGMTAVRLDKLYMLLTGWTGVHGWYDNGTKYVSEWFHPQQKEAIRYLAKLCKEGLMDKEIVVHQPYVDDVKKFTSGQAGAWVGHTQFALYELTLNQTFPNGRVSILPMDFKGPNSIARWSSAPWGWGTAIWAGSKDPQRCLSLLDYLASPEGQDLNFKGVEGIHYTIKDGKIEKNWTVLDHENWGGNKNAINHWWTYELVDARKPIDKDLLATYGVRTTTLDSYLATNADLDALFKNNELVLDPLDGRPLESVSVVGSKPDDVVNKYFAGFVTGEMDIDALWDTFLSEFRAAGYDKLEAEANAKYYKK